MKIGYQAGIKLLRAGAQLIVTTRFPRDAAARYAQEADFAEWGDRLEIFGLDLRHTPSVEAFCRQLADDARPARLHHQQRLPDRAAPGRLLPAHDGARDRAAERAAGARAPAARRLRGPAPRRDPAAAVDRSRDRARRRAVAGAAAARGRRGSGDLFPEGRLDQDLQQVDLRERNSWRLLLAEVSSVELLEVQLVNAVAPFVLNARLKPLMLRTPERDKHIVNVSAVEGQFYRRFKTTRHPHTNMAKAALNMMTRTSAADYHADGIHMNSVDTGWVTDEDPVAHRRAQDGGARLPSAARHRRRRRAHRRPDHRRLQHRRARLGAVPEGLPADGLVGHGGVRRSGCHDALARRCQRSAHVSRERPEMTARRSRRPSRVRPRRCTRSGRSPSGSSARVVSPGSSRVSRTT